MKFYQLLFILLVSCCMCGKDFEIIKSTSQKWYAGREIAGYGTYYKLTIVPQKKSDKMQFNTFWIGEKAFPVIAYTKNKNKTKIISEENKFAKNDTIYIVINDRTVVNSSKDTVNIAPPYKFEGEALLGYTVKGKKKYHEIKQFTKLKTLNYP